MVEAGGTNPDAHAEPKQGRFARRSLELNAVALMASTAVTALFGLLFWAVAARFPAAEVGRSSAVLSSATMFSQLASSNVGLLFGRVLASAGPRSRRVVLAGYGAAVAIGLAIGTIFVLFIPNDALFHTTADRIGFPLLVALFCLFTLQDWVIIGVRAASWVPLEQLVFSVAKLGLLVLFAALAVQNGILLAWALPCLLTVVVINPILLLRVLRDRPEPAEGAAAMPSRRELGKIFLAEYATGTVTIVIPLVLPLLVVARLGTEANAYYALPWLIGESLSLLMWNISSSFVVEASHDGRQTAALMKRALGLSALICGLGVPFLVIAAPWLLSFLGSNYADRGAGVLRLFALAVPFAAVTMMYINSQRVRNRMGRVLLVEAIVAVSVVSLTVFLLDRIGIEGAGWSYLLTQAGVALVVIVPLIRTMRASMRRTRDEDPPPDGEPLAIVPTPSLSLEAR